MVGLGRQHRPPADSFSFQLLGYLAGKLGAAIAEHELRRALRHAVFLEAQRFPQMNMPREPEVDFRRGRTPPHPSTALCRVSLRVPRSPFFDWVKPQIGRWVRSQVPAAGFMALNWSW